jgi:hypothetical protein
MKIQLLSDLHLEVHPRLRPDPRPAPTCWCWPVTSARTRGLAAGGARRRRFGLARFSPVHGWPTPVLFMPGNHEYDGLDFDAAHARLRDTCDALGMTLAGARNRGAGVACVLSAPRCGATSMRWARAASNHAAVLAQQLRAREKAFRAANFYLRKTGGTRGGAPFCWPSRCASRRWSASAGCAGAGARRLTAPPWR